MPCSGGPLGKPLVCEVDEFAARDASGLPFNVGHHTALSWIGPRQPETPPATSGRRLLKPHGGASCLSVLANTRQRFSSDVVTYWWLAPCFYFFVCPFAVICEDVPKGGLIGMPADLAELPCS